jgi:hypothetical protein
LAGSISPHEGPVARPLKSSSRSASCPSPWSPILQAGLSHCGPSAHVVQMVQHLAFRPPPSLSAIASERRRKPSGNPVQKTFPVRVVRIFRGKTPPAKPAQKFSKNLLTK